MKISQVPYRQRFILTVFLLTFAGCASNPDLNDPEVQTAITEARNLGLAYLEENRLEDAEVQFNQLVALNPNSAEGYANLGIISLRQGAFEKAADQLKRAISLDTQNPDIKLNLADAYAQLNDYDAARSIVQEAIAQSPDHVPTRYKYAQLTSDDDALANEHIVALEEVIIRASANIVPRLQLTVGLIEQGALEKAAFQLAELQTQLPALPKEIQPHLTSAQAALQAGDQASALRSTRIFHNLMKVTPFYQTGIRLLGLRSDALAGVPIISMPTTQTQATALEGGDSADILDALTFTDASDNADLGGLLAENQALTTMHLGDINGDGEAGLFIAAWDEQQSQNQYFLLESTFGRFNDITAGSGLSAADSKTHYALFADYDNDTFPDLYIVNEGRHQLFKASGEGSFEEVSESAGIAKATGGTKALFADLDHDGDLDLFIARDTQDLVYRNNGDGTFSEVAATMGLAGEVNQQTLDVDMADFDDDGDIDLITTHPSGLSLYSNQRQGIFENIANTSGLAETVGASRTAIGDYNNDGFVDLFVAGTSGHSLYLNDSGTAFTRHTENHGVMASLSTIDVQDARFLDIDNDGYLDLYLAGDSQAVLHNNGSGVFTNETTRLLPESIRQSGAEISQLAFSDYNLDRDLDLFLTSSNGPLIYRNDGGHANRSISMQPRGLLTNNSKNNYFSIGAKVEIRAGDLYQMRVVTEPTTYFGLGKRLKADVVRIVFTNGVPQNIFSPGTDQDIIEQQILKGSCPFLYTWNGSEFVFATDILWRSALGMPTGIMGGTTTYAPASPAEDYIKIPADLLQPKEGRYHMRITGELWETPFFDEVKLIVVDHPDTVDVFIDEKFGPPPATPLPVYGVDTAHLPIEAIDQDGTNVLAKLSAPDHDYLAPKELSRYQGLTTQQDLVLTPPAAFDLNNGVLYLKGWIFPTDASINVALTQSDVFKPLPPRVQVKDADGNWQTVIENMGFPMGKNKMVRVDLRGKFLSERRQVRIQTNMQIYWDHAFFANE
ncbi:MAG: FG-GAP-like repeat-containing protein, partial [Rhodothermales bacterium]